MTGLYSRPPYCDRCGRTTKFSKEDDKYTLLDGHLYCETCIRDAVDHLRPLSAILLEQEERDR